jgi:pimeloyl-ACP methyl ester carboxylesterase
LIYFPTPAAANVNADIISLKVGEETLRILNRPVSGPDAVIYFGGNAEDVSSNLNDFETVLPAHSIYLVNYPGYGGSTGSPSEDALFRDALAVYDLVNKSHPNISIIGRSLGTGVAVYLATARKVDKLVLVTPYDSLEHVAEFHYPVLPISLLLKDKFNSLQRVPHITARALVLLAENDEVIPRKSSDALISAFPPGQTKIVLIRGATHNSIGTFPQYSESMGTFLR